MLVYENMGFILFRGVPGCFVLCLYGLLFGTVADIIRYNPGFDTKTYPIPGIIYQVCIYLCGWSVTNQGAVHSCVVYVLVDRATQGTGSSVCVCYSHLRHNVVPRYPIGNVSVFMHVVTWATAPHAMPGHMSFLPKAVSLSTATS